MEKYEVEISCSVDPGVYWPSGLVARLRKEGLVNPREDRQVSNSDLIMAHLAAALADIHGVADISVAVGKSEDLSSDDTHQDQLFDTVTETHQSQEERV